MKRPFSCYVVGFGLLGFLIASAGSIVAVHVELLPLRAWPLLRTHVMCGLFGMLGASMASMRKYYRVLITEATARSSGRDVSPAPWDIGWTYYYLTRPILGGVLGALAFTLAFLGLSVLTEGTSGVSARGRYAVYGAGFLAGFAVSHMLDRLNDLARQAFKKTNEQ